MLRDRPSDPLAVEVVAVPAKGVERWLTQRLSHVLGSRPGRPGTRERATAAASASVRLPWPGPQPPRPPTDPSADPAASARARPRADRSARSDARAARSRLLGRRPATANITVPIPPQPRPPVRRAVKHGAWLWTALVEGGAAVGWTPRTLSTTVALTSIRHLGRGAASAPPERRRQQGVERDQNHALVPGRLAVEGEDREQGADQQASKRLTDVQRLHCGGERRDEPVRDQRRQYAGDSEHRYREPEWPGGDRRRPGAPPHLTSANNGHHVGEEGQRAHFTRAIAAFRAVSSPKNRNSNGVGEARGTRRRAYEPGSPAHAPPACSAGRCGCLPGEPAADLGRTGSGDG